MADKKLNIGSSFDAKGFQEMENALKRVTKLAQEFAEALKKVQFGKSDNKSSPDNFHNTVGQASEAVNKLNKALQDTDKTMIHGTQKSLVHTGRHLREYTNHANEAASATGRLHAAMGAAMGMGANASGSRFGAAAMFGGGGGGGGGSPPGLPPRGGSGGIYPPPPGGGSGGGGGGGFLNRIGYSGSGWGNWGQAAQFGLNASALGVGALNMGAQIMGGMAQLDRQELFGGMEATIRAQKGRDALFSMLHGHASGYGNILAQKGVAYNNGLKANENGMIVDPLAGPLNTAGSGAGFMDAVDDKSADIASGNIAAKKLGGYAKTGGKLVGGLAGGKLLNKMTGGLSAVSAVAGAGSTLFDGAIDAKLQTMQINQGEREAMRGEMQAYGFQLLEQLGGPALQAASAAQQGTAGVRLAASRSMGGSKHSNALFSQGASRGFDLGESTALGAGLAAQFGQHEARHIAPLAMDLANKGIDASTAGSVIGRVNEGGGQGTEVFRKLFADGVAQGMKQLDGQFFSRIGDAVASSAVTMYGGNASLATGSALMNGLGAHPSMRDVEGNIGGMKLANNLQAGNQFFASRNLVDAATILGKDGHNVSGEEMEILGGASFEDLMSHAAMGKGKGEKGNELLGRFGMSAEQAQEAMDRRVNRVGSILSGGTSAPAKRLQAAMEKFGSFQTALQKGGKEVVGDAAALGFSRLGGADLDSFKGMMRNFGGMSAGEIDKYIKGSHEGQNVADRGAMGEKNKQTAQVLQDVAHYGKLLAEAQKAALEKLKSSLETMKDMRGVEGLGAVKEVNQAFKRMGDGANLTADVLEEVAKKISKSMGIDITKLQAQAGRDKLEKRKEAEERSKHFEGVSPKAGQHR
jgi:hypothetical protein